MPESDADPLKEPASAGLLAQALTPGDGPPLPPENGEHARGRTCHELSVAQCPWLASTAAAAGVDPAYGSTLPHSPGRGRVQGGPGGHPILGLYTAHSAPRQWEDGGGPRCVCLLRDHHPGDPTLGS